MFAAISDPALRLAAGVGLVSLLLTLMMALQVILMRWLALRALRRQDAALARWRPLLVQAAAGEEPALPWVKEHERLPLLLLWNQMQESLRGDAHQRLNRLGERLGLYVLARRLVRRRSLAMRAMGQATLGHFAVASDWPQLARSIARRRWPASLVAARALLRIDPVAAAPMVLERYLAFDDWPAPRLGTILREAPPQAIGATLAQRLLDGNLYEQLRLLPLLRFAEVLQIDSVLTRMVHASRHPQVLSIALRLLHGPAALSDVRHLAGHFDPLVRSAAAQALGRIGRGQDEGLLVPMMADRNWWVRYRSAQAIVALPRVDADDVVQLRRTLEDRFARDMLDQVLAERALAGTGRTP